MFIEKLAPIIPDTMAKEVVTPSIPLWIQSRH